MPNRLTILAPMVCVAAAAAHAQRLAPPFVSIAQQADTQPSTLLASTGAGLGLGVVGFFAGGAAGYALSSNCRGELCQLPAMFFGAAAVGTFGMALGVHLGNRRQGNLAIDFLAGAGVWGIGITTIVLTGGWKPPTTTVAAVAVPVAQLVTTVLVEQATSRPRTVQTSLSIVPDGHGGAVFALGVPF
ncbi:MAG TPA: hypothetical protein VJ816_04520 [Gemmatimonadales bacterium]|nr:hypothetical protein [Gemmatimonadales bacterium]